MYNQDINSITDNIPAMSNTAFSAFYDVREVLYQNRKNEMRTHCVVERRATIGSSTNVATRNRNLSTGSFIPVQGTTPQLQQTSPPSTLISNLNTRDLAPVREHRKLDRSMSEPVGDRNLNALNNNVNNRQSGGNNINSSRYKTELCRPFEESGHCKYGDKCQFAHGALELRTLSRHPKYKTELCRTYHTIGFCPYGPRCHFIHNEDERKLGLAIQQHEEQQRLQQQQASRQSPPPPAVPTQQPPQQVRRPSTINFNSSFNGSLGSTADSPPSSASESPSLSPTLFTEDIYGLASQLSSRSNSASSSPVFNYSSSPTELSTLSSYLTPLNVQTQHVNSASSTTTDMNTLQQQFNALLNLNQHNVNNHNVFGDMDAFVAPPSPPDSISGDSIGSNSSLSSSGSSGFTNTCGSALDVSKSLRLPIFNRLSQD